jgi:LysM repeat protein
VSDWRDGELLRLHEEPKRRRGRRRFSIWTLVAPIALLASVSVIVVIARGAGWVGPATVATITPATTETSATTASETGTGTGAATTSTTASTPNQTKIFYTIRSGDTLEAVAVRYGTTVQKLLALNPGVNPNTLRIGQRIQLR